MLEDFDSYRELYIEALNTEKFPWRPAYYYYQLHSAEDEVMSFIEFKESVTMKSIAAEDDFKEVSTPIYDALDSYYEPVAVFGKQNQVIRVV